MDRRAFLRIGGAGAGALALGAVPGVACAGAPPASAAKAVSASYLHSATRWPWNKLSVDELARESKRLGIASVELLEIEDWPVVKKYGLTCAMGYAKAGDPRVRLTKGWNRREHHDYLLAGYREALPLAANAGVPNLICFSGNREGLDDEKGLEVAAEGLKKLMADAERHRVNVVMELFNSKVDHPDYMCDSSAWGVKLVERVGSERFKLLYDIYHMQIQEGDVIRTIRDHGKHFEHYHVAGVPGRHEPDSSQELFYPAVMRALAETGFKGYVAQEFIPTKDPVTALEEAVKICSV